MNTFAYLRGTARYTVLVRLSQWYFLHLFNTFVPPMDASLLEWQVDPLRQILKRGLKPIEQTRRNSQPVSTVRYVSTNVPTKAGLSSRTFRSTVEKTTTKHTHAHGGNCFSVLPAMVNSLLKAQSLEESRRQSNACTPLLSPSSNAEIVQRSPPEQPFTAVELTPIGPIHAHKKATIAETNTNDDVDQLGDDESTLNGNAASEEESTIPSPPSLYVPLTPLDMRVQVEQKTQNKEEGQDIGEESTVDGSNTKENDNSYSSDWSVSNETDNGGDAPLPPPPPPPPPVDESSASSESESYSSDEAFASSSSSSDHS